MRRSAIPPTSAPLRRKRILVLAERAEIDALSRCFERFKHGGPYEVLPASHPAEAIPTLTQGRPDLIVLDPQMKGLDGLRLLKQIRVIDPSIPVIVVTGQQTSREAVEVLKAGVFAYVPKPCDGTALEHLIALAIPAVVDAAGA